MFVKFDFQNTDEVGKIQKPIFIQHFTVFE